MATIYKRGRVWWLAYNLDGKRVQKSIGTYKYIADLAKKDIEVKIAKRKAGFAVIDKKLSEYVPQFLAYINAHSKPATLKRYREIIRQFLDFLETLEDMPTNLSHITPSLIEEYKLHRLQFVQPQTVNGDLSLLHHFFRHAVEMKHVQSNPTQGIKKIRIKKRKIPRFLSQEEVGHLLSECQRYSNLADIVKVLLNTGMRWGELQNLEWTDVDWNHRQIHIRIKEDWSPKGDERKVPINDNVVSVLRNLPRGRFVFAASTGRRVLQPNVWAAFKKACKKANLEGVTLHTLRHTFVSHLVMAGVDLATVSKLLGHKDISTTMIYSHLSPDHLRQAVKRLEY